MNRKLVRLKLFWSTNNIDVFYSNKEELNSKIEKIITSKNLRLKNNVKLLIEKFDWDYMIKKYDIFFKDF